MASWDANAQALLDVGTLALMAKDSGEVEFVQVATTFDAVEEAEALAASVVQARLAACAQSEGPVTSVYRWDGAVQKDKEWRVTFKTTAALADRLTEYIVHEHSYDVPEVLVTPVIGGHQMYLEWLQDETQRD